jgi:Arc/MetJ-type ribon-helix-helix transcriptional regulator
MSKKSTAQPPAPSAPAPPQTPDQVHELLQDLTFIDSHVADRDLPPVLADGEDALVPRSFKLPQRLDAALEELARDRRVSKSELVRQYLQAAVATDRADGKQDDLLIPLADAIRALTGLRPRPNTAA